VSSSSPPGKKSGYFGAKICERLFFGGQSGETSRGAGIGGNVLSARFRVEFTFDRLLLQFA